MSTRRGATRRWAGLFPDAFYLELQRVAQPGVEDACRGAVALAAELGLPVVATIRSSSWRRTISRRTKRRCALPKAMCWATRRPKHFTEEQHFLSARRCGPSLPIFPVRDQHGGNRQTLQSDRAAGQEFPATVSNSDGMTLDDYLVLRARTGAGGAAGQVVSRCRAARKRPEFEARLKFETDTIVQMGFPGYFLIVADFINWAKHNGCRWGRGVARGRLAGGVLAGHYRHQPAGLRTAVRAVPESERGVDAPTSISTSAG